MFKRYWWMLLAMIPVGAMAGLLIAAVITYVMPKMYESSAVIEIASRSKLGQGVSQNYSSPNDFGTEFELIKSRNTLLTVVESLDLSNKWGMDRDSAVQILKSTIVVESIPGTDLVSVKVRHTNIEDARDIAAEVVEAYKNYRTEVESKSAEKMVNELKKAVREQEDKVEERRKVITTIRRTSDPLFRKDVSPDKQGNTELEAQTQIMKSTKMELEAQIQSLLKYNGDPLLIYAAALDFPDNITTQLYPQYLMLKREIEGFKASGAADDDPKFVTMTKRLALMKAELDESVVNLRTRLQGQLEWVKVGLANVEIQKNESKKEAIERSIDTQDYVEAKRDFETELALLEQLKLRLITEEITHGMPNETVVVHDEPVIAAYPVSPNVTLNLVVGLIAGALFSPFHALPLMWSMNRRLGRDGLSEPSGSVGSIAG